MLNIAARTAAAFAITVAMTASALAQPPTAPAPMPAPAPTGPAKTVKEAGGADCTVWRPEAIKGKAPVIVWGNGRGQANTNYTAILDDLASWGFVVAAVNTTNAGTGTEMIGCLDYLTAENGKAGGALMGKLDLAKVGAAGHSMGGGGTLNAARDPRVKATVALLPYITAPTFQADAISGQHAPLLVFSGTADTIAPPDKHQQPVFDGVKVPVVWATLAGAGHMVPVTAQGGAFKPVITAWFKAQLMGDKAAKAMFDGDKCGLCTTPEWTVKKKGGA